MIDIYEMEPKPKEAKPFSSRLHEAAGIEDAEIVKPKQAPSIETITTDAQRM